MQGVCLGNSYERWGGLPSEPPVKSLYGMNGFDLRLNMVNLCTRCMNYKIGDLFVNDYCQYVRALDLLLDLDDDPDILTGDEVLVGRQRKGILGDVPFSVEQNNHFLEGLYTQFRIPTGEAELLRSGIEAKINVRLDKNQYAIYPGTIAEIECKISDCELCAILADKCRWRFLKYADEYGGQKAKIFEPKPSDACYLLPIWPQWKAMWEDFFNTPNESYVLITPSRDEQPLQVIDDCFDELARDMRTICLFDDPETHWKPVSETVDFTKIHAWLPHFTSNQDHFHELGTPKSSSFMLIDIMKEQIIRVSTLIDIKYAALSYVWGVARTSEQWCQDVQSKHDAGQTPVHFNVQALPRLLRDVFLICRQLSIQFVWIDSLCIALLEADTIADMGRS